MYSSTVVLYYVRLYMYRYICMCARVRAVYMCARASDI